ncbi:hypothetical protein F5Y04DRAFT_89209 [Hypomontagnella monticulosa]|nr:hypothetical protein F5Y04DRAFT_89209 [Hypomontagnella monticulosa]
MAMDVRDLSGDGVKHLTRLLSRRPEYGIGIPSRRWLNRQEEKFKDMPNECLRPKSLLKRFVLRVIDRLDPSLADPRAVLCKVHQKLNPWLIRRLFLVLAYEVTVHTDFLRTWKDRSNYQILSAFIGRIDAIAALWTEPDLYRECYGTPPFEGHMLFVRSGCEACILSALGANARALADIRSILVDRIERRQPRPDGRRTKDPRLLRYIDGWIDHLGSDRAARCRAMSENVLVELRARRAQLKLWRRERRYRTTPSGRSRSRSRHGIPVAEVDLAGAEDQRRAAMFSMTEEGRSIFRPDSLNSHSQLGNTRAPAYDPTNEQLGAYEIDPYDDYDDEEYEEGGPRDAERDYQEEEWSRKKVTDWYTTKVRQSVLSADDAKSVLSMAHPAFQQDKYSHASAAPSPLDIRKDRDRRSNPSRSRASSGGWTNATVYTYDPNYSQASGSGTRSRDAVPPVPKVPEKYRQGDSRAGGSSSRPSSSHTAKPDPRSRVASSVYSTDQRTPASGSITHSIPPRRAHSPARRPANRFLFMESEAESSGTSLPPRSHSSQSRYRNHHHHHHHIDLTPATSPRGSTASSTVSSRMRNIGLDDMGTLHPNDSASRAPSRNRPSREYNYGSSDDEQEVVNLNDAATSATPWPSFAKKKKKGKSKR